MGASAYEEATKVVVWLFYPVLMLWSTVGNVVVMIVLSQLVRRGQSCFTYFLALAICDVLGTLFDLLWILLRTLAGLDLLEVMGCGRFAFALFSVSDLSSYLLVAVALDRLLHVYLPHRAATLCSPRRAAMVVAGLLFLLLALNAHMFYTVDDADGTWVWMCPARAGSEVWLGQVWKYVDPFILAWVPFGVITGSSIAIAVRVRSMAKNTSLQRHRSGDKEKRANLLMLMVSVTFLVAIPPVVILHMVSTTAFDFGDPDSFALYNLLEAVFIVIFNLNRATNVVYYSVFNTRFRGKLQHMLRVLRFGKIHPASGRVDGDNPSTLRTTVSHVNTDSLRY